jgi:hypothetical protein
VLDGSVFSRRDARNNMAGADEDVFAVREDTEVIRRSAAPSTSTQQARAPSGSLTERQRSGGLGARGRDFSDNESERAANLGMQHGSNDLAALRAPSGHLRPIDKSGSLQLADVGGVGVTSVAQMSNDPHVLRGSTARRKLHFGDEGPSEADTAAGARLLAGGTRGSAEVNAAAHASSLLAGASVDAPACDEFTVLEAEDTQVQFLTLLHVKHLYEVHYLGRCFQLST